MTWYLERGLPCPRHVHCFRCATDCDPLTCVVFVVSLALWVEESKGNLMLGDVVERERELGEVIAR